MFTARRWKMADSSGSNPQSPGFTEKLKSWLCWSWTYICALWFAMVLTMVYVLRSPLKLQETVNAGLCFWSAVCMFTAQHWVYLFIKGKVHTNMNILPLFLSSPCKPGRLSFSVQYKSRNFEVSAGRCFPCNVNEWWLKMSSAQNDSKLPLSIITVVIMTRALYYKFF